MTSLEHELGRAVDAGLVLSEILVALNEQMNALEAGRSQQVLSRWRSLAPSATGTKRVVERSRRHACAE